jgi:hypothetical protein
VVAVWLLCPAWWAGWIPDEEKFTRPVLCEPEDRGFDVGWAVCQKLGGCGGLLRIARLASKNPADLNQKTGLIPDKNASLIVYLGKNPKNSRIFMDCIKRNHWKHLIRASSQ